MKFLSVVILSLSILSGILRAEEDNNNTAPNPAKAGFPRHWSATAWDAPEKAAFWKAAAPSTSDEKKAGRPLLSPPQPRRFLDRQSEK